MDSKNHLMKDIPHIWARKMLTILFAYDIDKDGIVSYEDCMRVADRIIRSANLKDPAASNVIQCFRDFHSGMDQILPNYWIKSCTEQVLDCWSAVKSPKFKEALEKFHVKRFQILDFDSDGFISFSEFLHYWKALNLDQSLARLQFDYMDTNKDGKISENEYVDAALDYELNYTDKDTRNRSFGPLVDF
ncbi:unnamed protein product [Owenia fusiformis]|uniref:Uncharacterized protein n=1 Tax=Owenia fusiformis TaxID=6347 RepID=A0A8J1XPW1_OWEFU|nr:unnamed protein product [Owenia fusiformis]